MKKVIILILVIGLFSSCKDEEIQGGFFIDTVVPISYLSQDGLDLLDPNNVLSFKRSEIDIYEIIDGEKVRAFEGHSDYPEHFNISWIEQFDKYYLAIYPHGTVVDGVSTSYINFGDGTEDRIDFEIKRFGTGSESCNKVWYNGVLMWDVTTANAERFIEIIK